MAEFDEKLNSLLSNPDAMSQIMQLAQSLSGNGAFSQAAAKETPQPVSPPPPPPPTQQAAPQQPFPSSSNSGDVFSSLAGGIDPAMLMKLLPLIQELSGQQDSHARQLLYALKPYLKDERQEKVERALQLAKLFHVGKQFLAKWEV